MASFLERAVAAAQAAAQAVRRFFTGEEKQPPAPAPESPAPVREPLRRVEFPIGPAGAGSRRLETPAATPPTIERRPHQLVLTGSTANNGRGHAVSHRQAFVNFTESQYRRYLYYQALGKTETARVYALAEVYGMPELAGASWVSGFDYDEFVPDEWPDADEYGDYTLIEGY